MGEASLRRAQPSQGSHTRTCVSARHNSSCHHQQEHSRARGRRHDEERTSKVSQVARGGALAKVGRSRLFGGTGCVGAFGRHCQRGFFLQSALCPLLQASRVLCRLRARLRKSPASSYCPWVFALPPQHPPLRHANYHHHHCVLMPLQARGRAVAAGAVPETLCQKQRPCTTGGVLEARLSAYNRLPSPAGKQKR